MLVRDYWDVEGKPTGPAEGVTVRWLIGEEHGAPHFAMRVFEVQPGCATPYHKHWWEHEVFVLDGDGVLKAEDEEHPVQGGSAVFVPGGEYHQFINKSDQVLRFICLIPHPKLEPAAS